MSKKEKQKITGLVLIPYIITTVTLILMAFALVNSITLFNEIRFTESLNEKAFQSRIVSQGIVMAFSIVVLVMFTLRSSKTPLVTALYMLYNISYILMFFYFNNTRIGADSVSMNQLPLLFAQCILLYGIWIPYLLTSDRVKKSFPGKNSEKDLYKKIVLPQ